MPTLTFNKELLRGVHFSIISLRGIYEIAHMRWVRNTTSNMVEEKAPIRRVKAAVEKGAGVQRQSRTCLKVFCT